MFLENYKIEYIREYQFDDCKYIKPLYFDFYLSEFNTCIEFDGEQHFNPMIFFGGIKSFEENKIRDQIKNDYCKENNINLIRIKYDENVDEKLISILKPLLHL